MQKPLSMSTVGDKHTDFYLISYADGLGVHFQNRNLLAASAINRGFDFILNYRRDHIDPDYLKQHLIFQEKKGAGYWLWKPYIILKTLQNVPDGSIVVYADSGLSIRKPIRSYINKHLAQNKDILSFYYIGRGTAAVIATGDTFAALNCLNDNCRNGHHVWAGLIVIRNSARSRALIQEWLKCCEIDGMLQGKTQRVPNYPEFSSHQHDQAILGVLLNRDANVVNFVPKDNDFYQYFNVHRRRKASQSLIAFMSIKNIDLEYMLQDVWPVNKLRNIMQPWTADEDAAQ